MTGFIAVHCGKYQKILLSYHFKYEFSGAGYHKTSLRPKYKKLCKEACKAAARILNAGGSAFLACETAVMSTHSHILRSTLTNNHFSSRRQSVNKRRVRFEPIDIRPSRMRRFYNGWRIVKFRSVRFRQKRSLSDIVSVTNLSRSIRKNTINPTDVTRRSRRYRIR